MAELIETGPGKKFWATRRYALGAFCRHYEVFKKRIGNVWALNTPWFAVMILWKPKDSDQEVNFDYGPTLKGQGVLLLILWFVIFVVLPIALRGH